MLLKAGLLAVFDLAVDERRDQRERLFTIHNVPLSFRCLFVVSVPVEERVSIEDLIRSCVAGRNVPAFARILEELRAEHLPSAVQP